MSERDIVRQVPDTSHFSAETSTASELRVYRRNHCAQCGRPFGMTRRRYGGKQFCSAQCVADYAAEARAHAQLRSHWYDFLHQRR